MHYIYYIYKFLPFRRGLTRPGSEGPSDHPEHGSPVPRGGSPTEPSNVLLPGTTGPTLVGP